MIKKIVKGKDFDGNEYTEELYFHLTEGDLLDWVTEEDGGLVEKIMAISKEEDPMKIVPIIKKILLKSYGIKTPDGRHFIKDKEALKNFEYSMAFNELYVELSTQSDKTVEFLEGVLPEFDEETKKRIAEARDQYEKEMAESKSDNA